MNTETGQVYRTAEEIEAARARGEPLAEVSEHVADMLDPPKMNRQQFRHQKPPKPVVAERTPQQTLTTGMRHKRNSERSSRRANLRHGKRA